MVPFSFAGAIRLLFLKMVKSHKNNLTADASIASLELIFWKNESINRSY